MCCTNKLLSQLQPLRRTMHLLMVFLFGSFGTAVHSTSRISQPGLKAVNFAKAIEVRKLKGSVIKEVEVDSEGSCQLECVEEENCQSYNFGRTKNNAKRFRCQVNGSDRFAGHANFTKDDNFEYRGMKSACEADSSLCGDKGVCIPSYEDDSTRCKCNDGYKGKPCKPESCAQLLRDGFTASGVYTINPDGGKPMQVLCDMTTDGGGWTVFQRRLDGSVDFFRDWASYKKGFGNLNGEFWLGNDNLHRLTAANNVTLRVDLEDFDGNITYAEYTTFKVANESDKYRILIGGYSGTAGNSMTSAEEYWKVNGMRFTTKDQDNDLASSVNCASRYKGAWWYNDCHGSNLNGLYLKGIHSNQGTGVNWRSFRGYEYSLKRTEMKIKANVE